VDAERAACFEMAHQARRVFRGTRRSRVRRPPRLEAGGGRLRIGASSPACQLHHP